MADNTTSKGSRPLITLFIVLHTFVWISSTIIILTVVLSRNVRRQVTWINLNLSWIIACFCYSLLFTTGQLFKSEPGETICLVQAAAASSVPSLTSGATLSLAFHLWFSIRSSYYADKMELKRTVSRNIALLTIPYVIPLIEFLAAFVYGTQHPEQVVLDRTGMLCGLTNAVFAKISAISVTVLMFATVVFEVLTIRSIKRNGATGIAAVIRLLAFTLFGLVGIGASLTYLTTKGADSSTANLLQAIPPVSFVFIFGLQWDIIYAWMFWRRDGSQSSSSQSMQDELSRSATAVEVKVELVRSTSCPGLESETKV